MIPMYIKTESGDNYWHEIGSEYTTEEVINSLKEEFGEEFAYISEIDIQGDCAADISKVYQTINDELDALFS